MFFTFPKIVFTYVAKGSIELSLTYQKGDLKTCSIVPDTDQIITGVQHVVLNADDEIYTDRIAVQCFLTFTV